MRSLDRERRELLGKVAEMYYVSGLSQQEIAARVHSSRSNVSRLLAACAEHGIVEIRINRMSSRAYQLRRELIARFQLHDAAICESAGDESARQNAVGRAAAEYLNQNLEEGTRLGIGWGRSILSLVENYHPEKKKRCDVLQLMGGTSNRGLATDGFELARRLSERFEGECALFHAPLVVNSVLLRDLLMQEPVMVAQLARFARLDLAIVGIGVETPKLSSMILAGYMAGGEAEALARSGVAGNVCGYLIDGEGALCPLEFNERIVGIGWETLKNLPETIGVACGLEKARAIRACLAGGIVKTLITDERTARAVLDETGGAE